MFYDYLKENKIDPRKVKGSIDYELNKNIHEFKIENAPTRALKDAKSKIIGGNFKNYAPTKRMNVLESRDFIKKYFNKFKYPEIVFENKCLAGGGTTSQIVNFTPTQDFVRRYFQPESAYKGILL